MRASQAKRFLRLGVDAVGQMWRAGKLDASCVWTGIMGSSKFLAALVSGHVRSESDAQACVNVCADCPSLQSWDTELPNTVSHWCGTPSKEDHIRKTCGCLVGVTINGGTIMPAGKTLVSTESCPQNRWEVRNDQEAEARL